MGGEYQGEVVAFELVVLGVERDGGGGGDVQAYTFGLWGVGLFADGGGYGDGDLGRLVGGQG